MSLVFKAKQKKKSNTLHNYIFTIIIRIKKNHRARSDKNIYLGFENKKTPAKRILHKIFLVLFYSFRNNEHKKEKKNDCKLTRCKSKLEMPA